MLRILAAAAVLALAGCGPDEGCERLEYACFDPCHPDDPVETFSIFYCPGEERPVVRARLVAPTEAACRVGCEIVR